MIDQPIRILTQDAALGSRISSLFNSFETTDKPVKGKRSFQVTGEGDTPWRTHWDSCQMSTAHDPHLALTGLVAVINHAVLEQVDLLAIHAGVIRFGSRIVVFPADSGQGKTTFTGAMLSRGAEYLSDEALVFRRDGTVVPYPKPLALSEWSCDALGLEPRGEETLATAGDFGAKVASSGPLTDVVITEIGSAKTTIDELPRSAAIGALLGHAFNHYKDPLHAFDLATKVASASTVWSLRYQDPIDAATLMMERISE